jgi:hypothetical protein
LTAKIFAKNIFWCSHLVALFWAVKVFLSKLRQLHIGIFGFKYFLHHQIMELPLAPPVVI